MTAYAIANGLKDALSFFESFPEIAEKAASLAINQVADRDGLSLIRRDAESQVAFPKGYLSRGDRLGVTKKARPGDLSAIIRGRDRATSLARFAAGQTPANTRKGGVRVEITPGKTRLLRKAFLVNLRNGNIGLAIRSKSPLRNSDKAQRLGNNLYLLYGPSVDQVVKGVYVDRSEELATMVANQFFRQFTRLARG